MLVQDNSSPKKCLGLQQELKKQKSQRFTISNQMRKKSPSKYFREMKSLKQHRQQTILKTSKSFQHQKKNEDNSSESSECDNVDEKSDMEEKKIAVPNLSFKEGLMFSHQQPEQFTHNSSDLESSQNKQHYFIKNIKKCQGDQSLMSDMNSQENLLSRDQDSFQNKSYVNGLSVQQIEEKQEFYEEVDPRILKKYQKHSERNPFEDPYYVVLTPLHGLERLNHELDVLVSYYVELQ